MRGITQVGCVVLMLIIIFWKSCIWRCCWGPSLLTLEEPPELAYLALNFLLISLRRGFFLKQLIFKFTFLRPHFLLDLFAKLLHLFLASLLRCFESTLVQSYCHFTCVIVVNRGQTTLNWQVRPLLHHNSLSTEDIDATIAGEFWG